MTDEQLENVMKKQYVLVDLTYAKETEYNNDGHIFLVDVRTKDITCDSQSLEEFKLKCDIAGINEKMWSKIDYTDYILHFYSISIPNVIMPMLKRITPQLIPNSLVSVGQMLAPVFPNCNISCSVDDTHINDIFNDWQKNKEFKEDVI